MLNETHTSTNSYEIFINVFTIFSMLLGFGIIIGGWVICGTDEMWCGLSFTNSKCLGRKLGWLFQRLFVFSLVMVSTEVMMISLIFYTEKHGYKIITIGFYIVAVALLPLACLGGVFRVYKQKKDNALRQSALLEEYSVAI